MNTQNRHSNECEDKKYEDFLKAKSENKKAEKVWDKVILLASLLAICTFFIQDFYSKIIMLTIAFMLGGIALIILFRKFKKLSKSGSKYLDKLY